MGEGAPNARYGESQGDALAFLRKLKVSTPDAFQDVLSFIDSTKSDIVE